MKIPTCPKTLTGQNHIFYPKKKITDSASSSFNVKKGIRCNYIPNMKAIAQILIEKNLKI